MYVYRWDLDRTYLDTAIDSVRGLLRTALEDASDKRTLPGARALLRGLQQSDPAAEVCILSGSPTQLRSVLEEKLAIDGIRFDKLILKDNLGNLRRGRLRALRGQVGYKLPILLRERVGLGGAVRESLFGDDSEADALIYVAYAEALAGRLSSERLSRVLEAGGAYEDHVRLALASLDRLGEADVVDHVFIRLDKRRPPEVFRLLGHRVKPVHDWLQAALTLHQSGRLDDDSLAACLEATTDTTLGVHAVGGLVQDAVRRGLVDREHVTTIVRTPAWAAHRDVVEEGLAWLPDRPAPAPRFEPDFLGFLEAIEDR